MNKFLIILFMFLLSSSISYGQVRDTIPSSTGEFIRYDDNSIVLPISYIRDINAKLIERQYLIRLNNEKDSLINLNKSYIVEQNNIIKDFQNKITAANNINNRLATDLRKQKNTSKILGGVLGGVVATVVIGILVK